MREVAYLLSSSSFGISGGIAFFVVEALVSLLRVKFPSRRDPD